MQSSQVPEKRTFWLRLSPRNGTAAQNEWCSVLLLFAVLGRCSHLATHFGKGGGCMVASENHSTRRSVGVLVLRDCSGHHLGPRSAYGTNVARSINMTHNSTLHSDVRASAFPCKGVSARAGGRGRWA